MIQNLIFNKVFDSKYVFFSKNIAHRSKLSKKVGKRQFWHFNNVNWQRKKIVWKQIVQERLMLRNQFHVKICCLVKIYVPNLMCGKRMFWNLTRGKTSDTKKKTSCIKLTRNWFILKILIRIWRFVKNLFQNEILFQSFVWITVFFPFLNNCWLLSKRKAATLAFFGVKRSKSDCLKAELSSESVFSQINFTSKSNAL